MTDRESYQHVANMLPETPTAVVVEWVRKEVWEHSGASGVQLRTGLTAGWPDLERLAAAQAANEGTTWQALVRRSIPKELGTIACRLTIRKATPVDLSK
jgi:hypothetical protein